jgi:hypothetical protein
MRASAAVYACIAVLGALPCAGSTQPVSDAEQRLFLDPHLDNLPADAVVNYRFVRSGSLEPGFEDRVRLEVHKSAQQGHSTHVDYLSGTHAFPLPDLESARGNPVILSFLERDVREMERMTGGKAAYFRKRVRVALAEKAEVSKVALEVGGRTVDGVRIRITPYVGDPLSGRYTALADKAYEFVLSQQVPGMLYEMHSTSRDAGAPADAPPTLEERLTFTGAEP